jgi:riboflavin transporter FmnP
VHSEAKVSEFFHEEMGTMNKQRYNTRSLVRMAILGAMGFALMYLEFPLPFLPPFLKYDFGDMPTIVAGFAMGPSAGLISQLIKVMIFFLSGKGSAGVIGAAANLVAGGTLTVISSLVFRHKSRSMALALIIGTFAMVVTTTITNIYVFLPLYGVPSDQVMPIVIGGTIPFNFIKGLITSTATILVYRRFRSIIMKG